MFMSKSMEYILNARRQSSKKPHLLRWYITPGINTSQREPPVQLIQKAREHTYPPERPTHALLSPPPETFMRFNSSIRMFVRPMESR